MIILAISLTLMAIMLFCMLYHAPIVITGIFGKDRHEAHRRSIDDPPMVSVIVPARNEETVIGRCLKALLSSDYPKDRLEIIVVDGASTDRTWSICKEFEKTHPDLIKAIREEEARGKPAALNLALKHAKGDIIAVFDADSVPARDTISKAVEKFGDPKVAAVQGRLFSLNEDENMFTKLIAMEEKAWNQVIVRGRWRLGLFVPLFGTCMFVRRSVLEELGGFDESSLTEDVDLAVRISKMGYETVYVDEAPSGIETVSNVAAYFRQRLRWFQGYMKTLIKYGSLLKKPSFKAFDTEVALSGPYMMSLNFFNYVCWALYAVFPHNPNVSQLIPLVLGAVLTTVSLMIAGVALTLYHRPIKPLNLLWIPVVYAYWILQSFVATVALINTVLRRSGRWVKTEKTGRVTVDLDALISGAGQQRFGREKLY